MAARGVPASRLISFMVKLRPLASARVRGGGPQPVSPGGEASLRATDGAGTRPNSSGCPSIRKRFLLPVSWLWNLHVLELELILGAYFVYFFTRGLVYSDLDATGLINASRVISAEKSLGFFWEPGWQSWAIDHAKALVVFLNWAYIITYWPVVLAISLVLYLTNRRRYYYYRTVVMINLVVALIVFLLFPLSSPFAVSDHFVNTIQQYGPSYYGSDSMAVYYNTNAAMPSLHFSWTVILGVLFAKTFKGWFKLLSLAYPALTFFAITLTGNHYILDAIAGGVLAAAAFAIMELVSRRGGFKTIWRRAAWPGGPAGPRGPASPRAP